MTFEVLHLERATGVVLGDHQRQLKLGHGLQAAEDDVYAKGVGIDAW